MKLTLHSSQPRGSAVVVMLVIIAMLSIFVVANAKRLHQLKRELNIVERRQLEKFHPPPDTTNIVKHADFTNQPPVTASEPH